jgi:NAD(P)H-hydrate repair Nnr-like enzyme with NAD(P)H-hydrate epimerase domain
MKVATAEIMRKLDRKAIDEFGIPGLVLMENAARGTVGAIFLTWCRSVWESWLAGEITGEMLLLWPAIC